MKKNKLKKIGISLVLLLPIITIFSMVGCQKSTDESESNIFKNMEATDIEGNKVDSSIFSGKKLILINMWATGCKPCIDEIPILDKLNKEYENKGVAIKGLLITFGEESEVEVAKNILEKAQSTYQQIIPSKSMEKNKVLSDISGFPSTYFVDENGNIVDQIDGSADYEGWKERIEEVLKKVEANE